MTGDTMIQKKVDLEEFEKFIAEYEKEQIECTDHTFLD